MLKIKLWTSFLMLFMSLQLQALETAAGLIILSHGSAKLEENQLQKGDKVFIKKMITTAESSDVKIMMLDRNIIHVLPNSKIRIEFQKNTLDEKITRFSLFYGQIKLDIEQAHDFEKNKFEIKTSTALLTLSRGEYIVNFNSNLRKTELFVLRGQAQTQGLKIITGKLTDIVPISSRMQSVIEEGLLPNTGTNLSDLQLKKLRSENTLGRYNSKSLDIIQESNRDYLDEISFIFRSNDNLYNDTLKNLINRPAQVIITPVQN